MTKHPMNGTHFTEADDVTMLTEPVDWPNWPVLPVKRNKPGWPELGVVIDLAGLGHDSQGVTVWQMNMHEAAVIARHSPNDFVDRTAAHVHFDTAEEAVAAGWRVD